MGFMLNDFDLKNNETNVIIDTNVYGNEKSLRMIY